MTSIPPLATRLRVLYALWWCADEDDLAAVQRPEDVEIAVNALRATWNKAHDMHPGLKKTTGSTQNFNKVVSPLPKQDWSMLPRAWHSRFDSLLNGIAWLEEEGPPKSIIAFDGSLFATPRNWWDRLQLAFETLFQHTRPNRAWKELANDPELQTLITVCASFEAVATSKSVPTVAVTPAPAEEPPETLMDGVFHETSAWVTRNLGATTRRFRTSPCLADLISPHFAIRQDVVDHLLSALERRGRAFLVGHSGSGKSVLALALCVRTDRYCTYVDLTRGNSGRLRDGALDHGRLVTELTTGLPEQSLIVVDNLHSLPSADADALELALNALVAGRPDVHILWVSRSLGATNSLQPYPTTLTKGLRYPTRRLRPGLLEFETVAKAMSYRTALPDDVVSSFGYNLALFAHALWLLDPPQSQVSYNVAVLALRNRLLDRTAEQLELLASVAMLAELGVEATTSLIGAPQAVRYALTPLVDQGHVLFSSDRLQPYYSLDHPSRARLTLDAVALSVDDPHYRTTVLDGVLQRAPQLFDKAYDQSENELDPALVRRHALRYINSDAPIVNRLGTAVHVATTARAQGDTELCESVTSRLLNAIGIAQLDSLVVFWHGLAVIDGCDLAARPELGAAWVTAWQRVPASEDQSSSGLHIHALPKIAGRMNAYLSGSGDSFLNTALDWPSSRQVLQNAGWQETADLLRAIYKVLPEQDPTLHLLFTNLDERVAKQIRAECETDAPMESFTGLSAISQTGVPVATQAALLDDLHLLPYLERLSDAHPREARLLVDGLITTADHATLRAVERSPVTSAVQHSYFLSITHQVTEVSPPRHDRDLLLDIESVIESGHFERLAPFVLTTGTELKKSDRFYSAFRVCERSSKVSFRMIRALAGLMWVVPESCHTLLSDVRSLIKRLELREIATSRRTGFDMASLMLALVDVFGKHIVDVLSPTLVTHLSIRSGWSNPRVGARPPNTDHLYAMAAWKLMGWPNANTRWSWLHISGEERLELCQILPDSDERAKCLLAIGWATLENPSCVVIDDGVDWHEWASDVREWSLTARSRWLHDHCQVAADAIARRGSSI